MSRDPHCRNTYSSRLLLTLTYCTVYNEGDLLTLIGTGVVSITHPNFERIFLKNNLRKVQLEKACNPQELYYEYFLLKIT
jgi:hypothetical protein